MKSLHAVFLAGTLGLLASGALASSASLTSFKPRSMAVLVEVNAHGDVTKVLPSTPLAPNLQRLLVKNLGEWITRPAIIKGHAVDSQMIINVAIAVTPRKDHKYDARFTYVSSLPAPFGGAAHWVLKDGYQLALVSDSGTLDLQRDESIPAPVQMQAANNRMSAPSSQSATAAMASMSPASNTARATATAHNNH